MARVRAAARVWLEWNGKATLGLGRVELLEAIERLGSISAAARDVGLSHRAASAWVSQLNELAGETIVETATGGVHGGGSRLTEAGRKAIEAYRLVAARIEGAVQEANEQVERLLGGPAPGARVTVARARRR